MRGRGCLQLYEMLQASHSLHRGADVCVTPLLPVHKFVETSRTRDLGLFRQFAPLQSLGRSFILPHLVRQRIEAPGGPFAASQDVAAAAARLRPHALHEGKTHRPFLSEVSLELSDSGTLLSMDSDQHARCTLLCVVPHLSAHLLHLLAEGHLRSTDLLLQFRSLKGQAQSSSLGALLSRNEAIIQRLQRGGQGALLQLRSEAGELLALLRQAVFARCDSLALGIHAIGQGLDPSCQRGLEGVCGTFQLAVHIGLESLMRP
mmetsp:Transcript_47758/g.103958  ORF Transcript_47758/g.103958 Transcript_47758/m.103958 type:complete len:261 (+) Transcript_47758:719-1501(+)